MRASRERRRTAPPRITDRVDQIVSGLKVHEHCRMCGKRCYQSRKDARRAGRLLYPGAHTREYRCLGLWHITSRTTRPAWRAAPEHAQPPALSAAA